jgi:type I restriction enzyme S subunit
MSNWKRCTLADLGEIVGGATPPTKNESYYGGDIAWITPKDLSTFHGRFISRGERNITAEGLKNSSARLMPPHSVLFTSRAPIGYVAIAENEVCTNQGFKSIVVLCQELAQIKMRFSDAQLAIFCSLVILR